MNGKKNVSERVYNPDSWVIIKLNNDEGIQHRVLAGFVEKPRNSEDWRVSKEIVGIELVDKIYHFTCSSGSVYQCDSSSYTLDDNLYNIWCAIKDKKCSEVELLKDYPNWLEYKWSF